MISGEESTSTIRNDSVTISAILFRSRPSAPNFAATETASLLRNQVALPVDALDSLDDVRLIVHVKYYQYDLPVKKPLIHF